MTVGKSGWSAIDNWAHQIRKWALRQNLTILFRIADAIAVCANIKRYGPIKNG